MPGKKAKINNLAFSPRFKDPHSRQQVLKGNHDLFFYIPPPAPCAPYLREIITGPISFSWNTPAGGESCLPEGLKFRGRDMGAL
jgi:hypothetical protein